MTTASERLREKISTPEFKAAVERHRAKLDAEEQGWTVMDPKRARALEAVAAAARLGPHTGTCSCHFCWLRRGRLTRALDRLSRVSGSGRGREDGRRGRR